MKNKVLFLDLDGVLNSHRSCVAFGDFPHGLDPVAVAKFDPVGLALVRHFCKATGVSVVLSSSWRILHPWAEVGAALQLPIIDATPRLAGPRGNEIAAWLAAHPEVEQWAILDDDSDMLESQLPRFVRTPHSDGLTWAAFEQLCSLFAITPLECNPRQQPAGAQSAA